LRADAHFLPDIERIGDRRERVSAKQRRMMDINKILSLS
jgi:hypothetical protein